MKIRVIFLSVLFVGYCQGFLYAQTPKIKSVEFKELERAKEEPADSTILEEATGLIIMKKEYKEYDATGQMVGYVLHSLNPGGFLIKNSEIRKKYEDKVLTMEERMKFDEMGDLLLKEKIYFNENKQREKVEFVDYIKDPNTENTQAFFYNPRNNKIAKTIIYNGSGKKIAMETWKYNRDDEEINYSKWEILDNNDKYKEYKKTSFNKDGTLQSSEKLVDDGKDVVKEITTFERNKIKEQIRYKNGEIVSEFGGSKAKFDPSKAKVLVDFGNNSNKAFGMWSNEDEYDDNGNKVKTTQTVDGVVTQITLYEYDVRGNLVKTKKENFEGEQAIGTEEEVQEFDKHNNMLRKAIYSNGELISEKRYDYQYH